MRNKISALIIDPHKNEHNYDAVVTTNTRYNCSYGEQGFELKVIPTTENILLILHQFRGVDCIITIGNEIDFTPLSNLSFEYRKRWIHLEEFNSNYIAESIVNVFINNINRGRNHNEKLFSIFTCTYKTTDEMIDRLYDSLCLQTYKNWNWFILDDTPDDSVINKILLKNDPRITIIKNVTNHGNIGFNKKTIAMMCDGDYLVEIDHDDELLTNCLEKINQAFMMFPDTDFVYSHTYEEVDGNSIYYGEDYACGLGKYRNIKVLGKDRHIPLSSNINALSIRNIYSMPNHVRCWKADFYRKIGGHNPELSVLDDMDLLIRTFLNGKMTLIDTVLYVQHEGNSSETARGETTQSVRFNEIQRTNLYISWKYDKAIHDRVIELGGIDPFWIEEENCSDVYRCYNKEDLINFNYILPA